MDAKAQKMKERFQKRQEARMAELQRKKEMSATKKSEGGNTEAFIKSFSENADQMTERLGKFHNGLEKWVFSIFLLPSSGFHAFCIVGLLIIG